MMRSGTPRPPSGAECPGRAQPRVREPAPRHPRSSAGRSLRDVGRRRSDIRTARSPRIRKSSSPSTGCGWTVRAACSFMARTSSQTDVWAPAALQRECPSRPRQRCTGRPGVGVTRTAERSSTGALDHTPATGCRRGIASACRASFAVDPGSRCRAGRAGEERPRTPSRQRRSPVALAKVRALPRGCAGRCQPAVESAIDGPMISSS
jgi:hypothetical protein